MSIWKKAMGAFVELEEKPASKPKQPPSVVEVKQIVQPVQVTSALSAQAEEFRTQFRAILEEENKRNFPGNDYYEFVEMKNAMAVDIPQEAARYRGAFSAWRVVGNQNKQTLLTTGQRYLDLVEKEIKEFEAAYQTQLNEQVGNNDKLIEQKSKEVQAMIEKMNVLNAEIQSLKQQSLEKTANLTATHDAFMVAGNNQRQEIVEELEKIKQYIS